MHFTLIASEITKRYQQHQKKVMLVVVVLVLILVVVVDVVSPVNVIDLTNELCIHGSFAFS